MANGEIPKFDQVRIIDEGNQAVKTSEELNAHFEQDYSDFLVTPPGGIIARAAGSNQELELRTYHIDPDQIAPEKIDELLHTFGLLSILTGWREVRTPIVGPNGTFHFLMREYVAPKNQPAADPIPQPQPAQNQPKDMRSLFGAVVRGTGRALKNEITHLARDMDSSRKKPQNQG